MFSARRTGLLDLYQMPTNGGGGEQELGKEVGNNRYVSSWSADFLLYQTGRSRSATGNDVWALPMSGDLTPRPFLRTPANEQQARFSPDGRWVAFTSDESGREEVFVVPFPGPGGRIPISNEGGTKSSMATGRHRDLLSGPPPDADGRRRERTECGIRSWDRHAASSRRASEPRAIRAMARIGLRRGAGWTAVLDQSRHRHGAARTNATHDRHELDILSARGPLTVLGQKPDCPRMRGRIFP